MALRGGIGRLAFAHGSGVAAIRDGGFAFAAVAWCGRGSLWQELVVGGTSVPTLLAQFAAIRPKVVGTEVPPTQA
ncbi:DUF6053 domain-containing protein [Lysobacter enzymogenes]|uniref:DUF6053 domain-containing protein n=1 Tax=Lysobacter enzymogenes TaxID=69 RepID=UPI00339AACC0